MSKSSEMEATLTAEDLRRMFRYEPESGRLVWRVSTSRRVKVGDAAGCVDGHGHRQVRVNNVALRVHRVVWCMSTGAWPTGQIDHINGTPDDNRIENLRQVTNAENCRNQKRRSDNTSGVTGVRWHKQTGKWRAQIQFNGRFHHLGLYDDLECAKAARKGGEDRFGFHPHHGRAA